MFILGISVRHQVDACNTYEVLLLASWHAIWYTLLRSQSKTKPCHGDVLGDESVESVQAGNCMIWRVVALLLVCSAEGVFWILEQPERSLMENHPAFQFLFATIRTFRVRLNMEDYGGRSKKPTWLYTSAWTAVAHAFLGP